MAKTLTCPRCTAEMTEENAEGLCPRCLIALNLSSPTEAPTGCEEESLEAGRATKAVALSLEEIAGYFPELEILKLLGRGGMGAVYMARQCRLNRIVALKILPPSVGKDPSFAERFTREAQALARLNHPHIVTLYEFGQKEGLFYFLMEYVDGVNLRQLLNASRLAPEEALAIVPQICDALQYAHEQGIVHRDVKPENLLLNKKGGVKIADFGVAKLVAERLDNPASGEAVSVSEVGLTEARGTLGTPQYMAPEQVARPLEVDHRADIYSLGVVFYQMLTGELPTGKFDLPSKKVVIDVRLDHVVLRALEKLPDRRYQHVSEVRKELETIQKTASNPTMPGSQPVGRPAALSRRFFGVVFGLVAMLGFVWWLSHSKFSLTGVIGSVGKEGWMQLASADLLKGRSSSAVVWTGMDMIVFGGEGLNVSFGDGARYNLEQNAWTSLLFQGAAPAARTGATAVWTGSAMIVWGGFGGSYAEDVDRNDGARFYPSNSVWGTVSIKGAPTARFNHAALWTGQEMLIWGGTGGSRAGLDRGQDEEFLNTGGRYDPKTDTWRTISIQGAPSKRIYPAVVWTGREMLVWGGRNGTASLDDGARYDPAGDSWQPMSRQGAPSPRSMALAVWTGTEMIVWSGCLLNTNAGPVYFRDGARYNPQTDTWTPLNTNGAPTGRVTTQAIWTGKEMLVWGGVNDAIASSYKDPRRYVRDGARYNPTTDAWTEISALGAPTPRAASAMVWSGKGLLLFGGFNGKHLDDTFHYLPPSYH